MYFSTCVVNSGLDVTLWQAKCLATVVLAFIVCDVKQMTLETIIYSDV